MSASWGVGDGDAGSRAAAKGDSRCPDDWLGGDDCLGHGLDTTINWAIALSASWTGWSWGWGWNNATVRVDRRSDELSRGVGSCDQGLGSGVGCLAMAWNRVWWASDIGCDRRRHWHGDRLRRAGCRLWVRRAARARIIDPAGAADWVIRRRRARSRARRWDPR